jgi:hypothetical protein
MLNASIAQQNYISVNYTQALHALLDRGVNVIALLVRLNKAHNLSEWLLRWFVVWGLRA